MTQMNRIMSQVKRRMPLSKLVSLPLLDDGAGHAAQVGLAGRWPR